HLEPFRIGRGDQSGDFRRTVFFPSGNRRQGDEFCIASISDKTFGTVDHPFIAFPNGVGSGASCIRSGLRLCQTKGAQTFPLTERNEVFLFLLFRSKKVKGGTSQRNMGRIGDANGSADPGQLLHRDGKTDRISASTPVFFRKGKTHEIEFSHLFKYFYRKRFCPVSFVGTRRYFTFLKI